MSEQSPTKPPPPWALDPITGWVYLAASVALIFTPLVPLNLAAAIVAAVFTYKDRRAYGFPTFWWTAGVVVLGAFVYIFFIYKRPKGPVVFSPAAAISQQAHLVRGLPPRPEQSIPPTGSAPADWYPDPTGKARIRYWSGSEWTDHTSN